MDSHFANYNPDTLVVCGFNKTRIGLNRRIRNLLGFDEEEPTPGERVICLKNNRRAKGGPIYNGMLGTLREIESKWLENDKHWYRGEIEMDHMPRPYHGLMSAYQFGMERTLKEVDGLRPREVGDLFDWGYAITCHKAQGSECPRVLVVDEPFHNFQRWRYTALTRARDYVSIAVF